jgi:hypothetical protein
VTQGVLINVDSEFDYENIAAAARKVGIWRRVPVVGAPT